MSVRSIARMLGLSTAAAFVMAASMVRAAAPAPVEHGDRFSVPDTVSPEAKAGLDALYGLLAAPPPPSDIAAIVAKRSSDLIAKLRVTLTDDRIGGVKILRIRPAATRATGWTLVYLHGGGYVGGSTRAMIGLPALIAARTGSEVISIDYTLAPHADWRTITGEVVTVWRGLLAAGADPHASAIFGDSAGGSLTAGATLRLRDEGVPLPAALYLVSPWADISARGDTYGTLSASDPILALSTLAAAANAYARPEDRRHPYVSPVYGDYAKGFPPTLIQCGTREMFVSNCVREYQAIRGGGHEAVLDLYEGMPHAFPGYVPYAPETDQAVARAADFLAAHLRSSPGMTISR